MAACTSTQLLLVVLVIGTAVGSIMQPEVPITMRAKGPPSNGRTCYGCIGWCTYGRLCTPPANIQWHDVAKELGISGQGWPTDQMASPFNRFPAKVCALTQNTNKHAPHLLAYLLRRTVTLIRQLERHILT